MTNTDLTRRELLAAGSAAVGLLLAACGGTAAEGENEASEAEPAVQNESAPTSKKDDEANKSQASASKALVVFCSRADENYPGEWLEVGHTKVMAGYIAEALDADTYEIVPVEAYPEGYDDCCDQALEEQRDDVRPAIANELPDVSGYDQVFIGCPIWWGDEPMIVRTFIEAVDLGNKTIVPFTTHGGSGLGNVPANLRAAIPNATFLDGLAVAGTDVDGAKDQVVDWAKGCSLS